MYEPKINNRIKTNDDDSNTFYHLKYEMKQIDSIF